MMYWNIQSREDTAQVLTDLLKIPLMNRKVYLVLLTMDTVAEISKNENSDSIETIACYFKLL